MADRPSKLRKLNDFRRALPHVSASALSAVLNEIATEGAPELRSRRDLARATGQLVTDTTPYGQIQQTVLLTAADGTQTTMLVSNPLALLWKASRECSSFASFVAAKLAATPCSPEAPWQLIVYSDEVVPGNQLAHENRRKVWVVYFSFLEFGPAALSKEGAWFCILAKQSIEVAKISGGISQVFGSCLKLFLQARTTCPPVGSPSTLQTEPLSGYGPNLA